MIKTLVRGMAHKLGYDLARKPRAMMKAGAEIVPTIELLAPYLSSVVPQVTFVQVGAYDGQANDPLVQAAVRFGWRGVLVEPQSGPFARLQALHAGRPGFQLRHAAVGATDGKATLYTIRPQPGLPDWAYQNASFNREHILKTQSNLEKQGHAAEIEEQRVDSVTFDRLLAEAGLNRVDVLQIDVEGHDYEILKLFRVAERLPRMVNFEHVHLSSADWEAAVSLLVGAGYQVARSGFDTLAVRFDP